MSDDRQTFSDLVAISLAIPNPAGHPPAGTSNGDLPHQRLQCHLNGRGDMCGKAASKK